MGRIGGHPAGEGRRRQRHDRITGRKADHSVADGRHPGALAAEAGRRARVHTQRGEHVPMVAARRADLNLHLPAPGARRWAGASQS